MCLWRQLCSVSQVLTWRQMKIICWQMQSFKLLPMIKFISTLETKRQSINWSDDNYRRSFPRPIFWLFQTICTFIWWRLDQLWLICQISTVATNTIQVKKIFGICPYTRPLNWEKAKLQWIQSVMFLSKMRASGSHRSLIRLFILRFPRLTLMQYG